MKKGRGANFLNVGIGLLPDLVYADYILLPRMYDVY